jgi:restriction system protein
MCQFHAPIPDVNQRDGAGGRRRLFDDPTKTNMRKRRRRRRRPFRPLIIAALVAGVLSAASAAQRHPVAAVLIATSLAALAFWVRHRLQRKRRVRIRTLDQLLAMSPARFEQAIASLFRELGYRRVRTVGRSGDLAVDIECRDAEGRPLMIQCKRYAPGLKVGSRDVQTFVGMIFMHHRADSGVFVTTSSFTKPAVGLARDQRIELIDGRRLATLLVEGPAASLEGRRV